MKAVASLLAIFALSSASPFRDNGCNDFQQSTTRGCLKSYYFNFNMNIDNMPNYSQYIDVWTQILNGFGTLGVRTVCKYVTKLDSCLGNLKDTGCMQPAGYAAMFPGLDSANATAYAVEHATRTYECSVQDQYQANMPCLKTVADNHKDMIAFCEKQLNNDLASGSDTCSAIDDYADCMMDLYVGQCGDNVKDFVCNTMEIAMNFDTSKLCEAKLPKCNAVTAGPATTPL